MSPFTEGSHSGRAQITPVPGRTVGTGLTILHESDATETPLSRRPCPSADHPSPKANENERRPPTVLITWEPWRLRY